MLARQCRKALRTRVLTLQQRQQQQLRLASSAPPPRVSASAAPATTAATAGKAAGGKAQESDFSRYAGIAVFSAIVATTAYLGTWQTQRYFWKVDLVEERKRELHEDAVALPKDASAKGKVDDIEYRQLRVTGKLKPNSTYYLYPRSAPAESTDNVATPKSGGYLYSLLERDDGTPVIVNRGWLPRKLLDQHMASETKEEHDEISLVGVLRHGEEKGHFTPDNDVKNRQFFYLQHEELARVMGIEGELLPVILDALSDEGDSAEASLTHPLRKKLQNYTEFYMTPSKHAGYAATWYSFSVAAAAMAYFRFKKGNAAIRPKKR
ncbi:Sodium hydrogen exchanger 3 [Globisporangium polare]